MSTIYCGLASNVTPPSALTITNVSGGATPTITVSAPLPAYIVTTFPVSITGVQGATLVNAVWTATKTGASTFTVPSSAPGTYTTGGSAQPLLLQAITIPNDGESRSAISVNVPFESHQDQLDFLAAATGADKAKQIFTVAADFTDFSTLGTIAAVATGGAFADWTGSIASTMPFVQAAFGKIYVNAGDLVRATVNVSCQNPASNGGIQLLHQIFYSVVADGATPIFQRMPGASATIQANNSTLVQHDISMSATVLISSSGVFDFKIMMKPQANTVGNVLLIGGVYAEAIVYRPTGMVQ